MKGSIILVMCRRLSPLSTFWIIAFFQELSQLVYYTRSEPFYHLGLFCRVGTSLKQNKNRQIKKPQLYSSISLYSYSFTAGPQNFLMRALSGPSLAWGHLLFTVAKTE